VTRTSRYRAALFAASLLVSVALVGAHAQAALDLVVGPHLAVPGKTIADCGVRSQAALTTVLGSGIKAGDDGTNWLGFSRPGGATAAVIVIHCLTMDSGYLATFSCSAEVPPNPDTADALCTKITAAFGATP
jgi:hypothetical protein